MKGSFVVFAFLIALASSIQVNDDGKRQFIPSDLTGVYELFVKQGQCPQEIIHKEFVGLQRGAYQIPHKKIQQDGSACSGKGALTVISKKAIEATGQNTSLLRTGPIAQVIEALENQGTEYMVGYEFDPRTCGDSTISARTTFVFVEDEKQLKIPDLIDLFPGAKYMIMYDETSSTPCTYAAKSSESIIGNPPPSPKPAAEEPIVDESEEIEGSSVPVSGGPGSDGSESGDSAEAVNGESGARASESGSDGPSEGAAGSGKRGGNGDATPDEAGSSSSSGNDATGTTNGPDGSDSTADSSSSSDGVAADSADRGTISGIGSDSDGTSVGSTDEEGLITGIGNEELPEESPEDDDSGSVCFPRDMVVTLDNGEIRRMDEVAIGDRVLVGNGKYSEVFMFTHQSSSKRSTFIRLTTKSEESIELTPEHYIYSNGQLVTAKNVNVGDLLLLKDGRTSEVVEISFLKKAGVYNPQTAHGDIVVNGVLASTFTSTVNPSAAQPLLAPFRAVYNAVGITCSAFNNGTSKITGFLLNGKLTL